MHIRYGYTIEISCAEPMPLIAMLDVHPSRHQDVIVAADMVVTSLADNTLVDSTDAYNDQFGNICRRIVAPAGGVRLQADGLIRDSGLPDRYKPDAVALPPEQLPSETLIYLMGSRYCETDRLTQTAWNLFGHITGGWDRVQAVCTYVHEQIRFDYMQARHTRTAAEAHGERVGVCRDFAHLAVTLCRCLNIPARYCTGYLGDINVPLDHNPMDFSAWFEAYLDGEWYTFDARHNARRIGRIVIGRGRDAADVPILNSFGLHLLQRFDVVTDEVPQNSPSQMSASGALSPPGSDGMAA